MLIFVDIWELFTGIFSSGFNKKEIDRREIKTYNQLNFFEY